MVQNESINTSPETLWPAMPGIVITGQHIDSERICSIEASSPSNWTLYAANRIDAAWDVEIVGKFSALGLYRQLLEEGFPVPLEWTDQYKLDLPDLPRIYWGEVERILPGHLLGSTEIFGSCCEWSARYSITWDGRGGWNLHMCGEPCFWLDEPSVYAEWSMSVDSLVETLGDAGYDAQEIRATIRSLRRSRTKLDRIRLDRSESLIGGRRPLTVIKGGRKA